MVHRRMWRRRRGQSVVEYILIASAVIGAIVAIRTLFAPKVSEILQAGVDKTAATGVYLNTVTAGTN